MITLNKFGIEARKKNPRNLDRTEELKRYVEQGKLSQDSQQAKIQSKTKARQEQLRTMKGNKGL